MAVIIGLQLAALAYGVWTAAQARPTHLVFEYSKFTVLHRIDIENDISYEKLTAIEKVFPGIPLPVIALRSFTSANEKLEYTMAAMAGVPLSTRAELWSSYDPQMVELAESARPLDEDEFVSIKLRSLVAHEIDGLPASLDKIFSVPLTERSRTASVILMRTDGLLPVSIVPDLDHHEQSRP